MSAPLLYSTLVLQACINYHRHRNIDEVLEYVPIASNYCVKNGVVVLHGDSTYLPNTVSLADHVQATNLTSACYVMCDSRITPMIHELNQPSFDTYNAQFLLSTLSAIETANDKRKSMWQWITRYRDQVDDQIDELMSSEITTNFRYDYYDEPSEYFIYKYHSGILKRLYIDDVGSQCQIGLYLPASQLLKQLEKQFIH